MKLSCNFRVYHVLAIFSYQGNNHPVKSWGRYFHLKELIYDPWRRKWQLTPVFLPGKSHGWRSLMGYSPSVHKESDLTERLASIYDMHQPFNPKGNQLWIFIGRTDAEADVLMQRADSWGKILMLGKIDSKREGSNRGWAGWMASPTQWTWVWANSGRWWRTRKPGILQFMGSQTVRDYLTTKQ